MLTIELRLRPQQLDIVRRALRRHYEALSWVPARQTGDPDPTPLQREFTGSRELLGHVGWIDALDEGYAVAGMFLGPDDLRFIEQGLVSLTAHYVNAAREQNGGSGTASFMRLSERADKLGARIRHALGDDDESER